MATMTISLDTELRKMIEETADQGGYTSTSEVVREALRAYFGLGQGAYRLSEWEAKAVQEGLDSGESTPLDMEAIIKAGEAKLKG